MININRIGKALLLAAFITFASCSKEDNTATSVTFPELQTINAEQNSTIQISFDASGKWKLSSSALWCHFIVDGTNSNSCQGQAGAQKLNVVVTDDALTLTKQATSNLTLEIEGQEKVIFKVVRTASNYELKVLNMDQEIAFDENNPLVLEYNKDSRFMVVANCEWTLKSLPEWLSAKNPTISNSNSNNAVCGSADESVIAEASVNPTFQYTPQTGEMVFVNKDSQLEVTIPVKFEGMPSDEVDFSLAPNQRFNWVFSADSWTVAPSSDMGTSTTEDTPKVIQVWAKDQDYECVCLVKADYGYVEMSPWDKWYYVTKFAENSKISITVDPNSGDVRKGCILVLPRAVYDEIGQRYDDFLYTEDWMDIKPQYTKYIAMDFSQDSPAGSDGGFDIKNMGWLDIPSNYVIDMTTQMDESTLQDMFGTSNVWMLATEEPYSSLMITPKGLDSDYFETSTYYNGHDTKFPSVEFEPMGNCIMLYNLDTPTVGEMVITFVDGYTGEIAAVLLVSTFFG